MQDERYQLIEDTIMSSNDYENSYWWFGFGIRKHYYT